MAGESYYRLNLYLYVQNHQDYLCDSVVQKFSEANGKAEKWKDLTGGIKYTCLYKVIRASTSLYEENCVNFFIINMFELNINLAGTHKARKTGEN